MSPASQLTADVAVQLFPEQVPTGGGSVTVYVFSLMSGGPAGPVGPGGPSSPVGPGGPSSPVGPGGPWSPVGPGGPWSPVGHGGPCTPEGP